MTDQLIQTAQLKPKPANENKLPVVAAPALVEAEGDPKAKFSALDDKLFHIAMRLRRKGHPEEAIAILETLYPIYPNHIWMNVRMVDCYMDMKNYKQASDHALKARKLKLDRNQLNCVRCVQYFCYFFLKDYKKAWPIYLEFLGDIKRGVLFDKSVTPHRFIPRWDGVNKKQTIAIVNDEGIGDGIFMSRFIKQFRKFPTRAIVMVKPSLIHLYKQNLPEMEVISLQTENLKHIDVWTSVMDIPHFLDVPVEEYFAKTPYVKPKSELVATWGEKINTTRGLKVGISWQGNPDIDLDKYRSVPLEKLKPLSEIAGIRLISLQKGFGEDHLKECSFKDKIETLGEFDTGSHAFEDTLAICKNMDVVLTIDSSLSHICGAAHIPCMVMLNSFLASWRWGVDKHNTEWYPYHRLFKQDKTKAWDNVIPEVVRAISVMRDNRVPLLK